MAGSSSIRMGASRVEILEHGGQRSANGVGVGPVPDFLAELLRFQHASVAQYPQVVRYRGTRKRGGGYDLPDVETLPGLEHQQNSLPVRIAERDEHPRRLAPGTRDCAGIARSHDGHNY